MSVSARPGAVMREETRVVAARVIGRSVSCSGTPKPEPLARLDGKGKVEWILCCQVPKAKGRVLRNNGLRTVRGVHREDWGQEGAC